jgi:hypothetical protein
MPADAQPSTDATTRLPAANGAVPPALDEARLADEELVNELHELEKQFPLPEKGATLADARWYVANASALYQQYCGEHVAIMNGTLVGHDWNELRLRRDVTRKYNVHPQSFLVVYLFSIFG